MRLALLDFKIADEELSEKMNVLEEMLAAHLLGPYHLTRMFIPGMIKQKSGHIFNICSIASLQAYPNGGSYSISKFALAGFSKKSTA